MTQNFKSNPEVVHEAFALAANLAFAQPKNPFGMNGWAHLFNQVNQLLAFVSRCSPLMTHAVSSQAEIGRMGGIRLIINAMTEHAAHWHIQDRGIRALANLAYNSTANIMVSTAQRLGYPLGARFVFLLPLLDWWYMAAGDLHRLILA